MFVSNYEMDNELLKEFAQKIGCKNTVKQWIILLCISIIMIISFFAITEWEDMGLLTKVLLLGLPVYCSVWLFTAPHRCYKTMVKHRKKLSSVLNGHRTVIFTENIAVSEGTSNYTLEYSDVTKLIEYRTFFYLFVNKQMGCIVGRSSFGDKTDEEFLDFLREKCVNVKN